MQCGLSPRNEVGQCRRQCAYPNSRVATYAYLPAQGTRGCVIVVCSHDLNTLQSVVARQYSISVIITSRADNSQWSITGVYEPQEDHEKIQFISDMRSLQQQMLPSWVILGDFNLIYRACNKNTDRVNRGMMHRFKSALDNLELKEIHLHVRKYTWSSETDNPCQCSVSPASKFVCASLLQMVMQGFNTRIYTNSG